MEQSTVSQAEKHSLRSWLDCEPQWLIPKNVLSNYFLGLAQSDVHSGSRALFCFIIIFAIIIMAVTVIIFVIVMSHAKARGKLILELLGDRAVGCWETQNGLPRRRESRTEICGPYPSGLNLHPHPVGF